MAFYICRQKKWICVKIHAPHPSSSFSKVSFHAETQSFCRAATFCWCRERRSLNAFVTPSHNESPVTGSDRSSVACRSHLASPKQLARPANIRSSLRRPRQQRGALQHTVCPPHNIHASQLCCQMAFDPQTVPYCPWQHLLYQMIKIHFAGTFLLVRYSAGAASEGNEKHHSPDQ